MNTQTLIQSNLHFFTPTTCSTKFPYRNTPLLSPRVRFLVIKSGRRGRSQELQKQPKKELSRILRTEAAVKSIERKANSNKYHNLLPKAVLEALDEAIRGNRWESALKIFSLLRKQHWYEPRSQTYTKLLVMLGKCKQPKQASFLFEILKMDGLKPTIDAYTALVSAYGLSGLFDEAFSTLESMKLVPNCKPDVYTYSILIKCCVKLSRFDLIEDILAEMSYMGVESSIVTYNTIIDGYGKAGLFEEMDKTLTDLINSENCVPDIFTFNSFLGAYGNFGKIKEMEKCFDEFQVMGINPDIKTFNILIRSYGKAGIYEKMNSVLEYMKKRCYSPTIVTYNIIIEAFGNSKNIEKMDEFFLKMKHQGMKPNAITYCSLVRGYSKSELWEKVDSILKQVENSDVVLDTPFFNCAISAYGQAGDVDYMYKLFLMMRERNCKPDYITFVTMIQAYNALGMTEAAIEVENKMIAAEENSGVKFLEK